MSLRLFDKLSETFAGDRRPKHNHSILSEAAAYATPCSNADAAWLSRITPCHADAKYKELALSKSQFTTRSSTSLVFRRKEVVLLFLLVFLFFPMLAATWRRRMVLNWWPRSIQIHLSHRCSWWLGCTWPWAAGSGPGRQTLWHRFHACRRRCWPGRFGFLEQMLRRRRLRLVNRQAKSVAGLAEITNLT